VFFDFPSYAVNTHRQSLIGETEYLGARRSNAALFLAISQKTLLNVMGPHGSFVWSKCSRWNRRRTRVDF